MRVHQNHAHAHAHAQLQLTNITFLLLREKHIQQIG